MKALVLLHGWGMNASVFDELAVRLAVRYRVHAPDLPGYSGSAAYKARALGELAEEIGANAPERCCVVGWSLGAQIALAWARARPAQVERLALVSATPCFSGREDWALALAPVVLNAFKHLIAEDAKATLSRFASMQARGDAAAKHVRSRLRASLAARPVPRRIVLQHGLEILAVTDLRGVLGEITQPTLVVHGERDELVPLAAAEYLAHALANAKMHVVPGASHAPFVSDPDAVSASIMEHFA